MVRTIEVNLQGAALIFIQFKGRLSIDSINFQTNIDLSKLIRWNVNIVHYYPATQLICMYGWNVNIVHYYPTTQLICMDGMSI